jgi:hypothetical protein
MSAMVQIHLLQILAELALLMLQHAHMLQVAQQLFLAFLAMV